MPANSPPNLALSDGAARQLANATKTTAQMSTISPRWLVRFMDWVPVEAGIYRLNKVKHPEEVEVACPPRGEIDLPTTPPVLPCVWHGCSTSMSSDPLVALCSLRSGISRSAAPADRDHRNRTLSPVTPEGEPHAATAHVSQGRCPEASRMPR
jgi:hypothetical protein